VSSFWINEAEEGLSLARTLDKDLLLCTVSSFVRILKVTIKLYLLPKCNPIPIKCLRFDFVIPFL
jgi:hypothetical protein